MTQYEGVAHVNDDDDAVLESLRFLLESAGIGVRTYDSANAFLRVLSSDIHGCVVTDIRMPGVSGIELLRHLSAMAVALPVIVVTGHADVPLAIEALKCGAKDFLEKPFDDDELLSSIRSALHRHERDVGHELVRSELHARLGVLTERERQVLDGLLASRQNKTIASDLGISPQKVEIHRASVMTKMQATNLSRLVRMALVAGLIGAGS